MKVLEKHDLDVEALDKFNKEEVARLGSALATTERENNAEREEKLQIEQITYNDAYEPHECSFNHCLRQVLFHCKVQMNPFSISTKMFIMET